MENKGYNLYAQAKLLMLEATSKIDLNVELIQNAVPIDIQNKLLEDQDKILNVARLLHAPCYASHIPQNFSGSRG